MCDLDQLNDLSKVGVFLSIDYSRALDLMRKKGLTTYKIRKGKLISESSLQSMREGKPVSTKTIEQLCIILDCQPNDLMIIKNDAKE